MLLARAYYIPGGSYIKDKNTDRYLFICRWCPPPADQAVIPSIASATMLFRLSFGTPISTTFLATII